MGFICPLLGEMPQSSHPGSSPGWLLRAGGDQRWDLAQPGWAQPHKCCEHPLLSALQPGEITSSLPSCWQDAGLADVDQNQTQNTSCFWVALKICHCHGRFWPPAPLCWLLPCQQVEQGQARSLAAGRMPTVSLTCCCS